jgi:predicted Fe-S protein YdhL (DUF1289 family)
MVEDSPCTGTCRLKDNRCVSCYRTYQDISEWFDLSKKQRLERMEQLKKERNNHGRTGKSK